MIPCLLEDDESWGEVKDVINSLIKEVEALETRINNLED